MRTPETLLAAVVSNIAQRLLALDAELFTRYARRTPAMEAMGFPETVSPPGLSITDLPDVTFAKNIEVLAKFQDLPLMGYKFTGAPVLCAGVTVRNVYYFWTSPMSALVGSLMHKLALSDREIVLRLTLAALLLLRRRAVRHGAYFPKLRLYTASGHSNAVALSCPCEPIVEDNLVFSRLLLKYMDRNAVSTNYRELLPLFINEHLG